ncbi:hypothetical protein RM555_14480 [Micromonospora sp. DSM 115977]|uniref:Uncharacterized protein n=1 Tax=Micromonospora reichwaldensis TaxID=3075516 RepID=A0ABU2WYA1_9ACTN|nr:hypothetical protein [Micromonospora sp. DSM 115977]MDT0530194.1 hypothetical protein [Micromonospora sp. DSM 115977]
MSSTVHASAERPPLLRSTVAAQSALTAAFVVVLALGVGRMAAAGVGPEEMRSGAYDPKDLVPFGLSGANPLTWLYGAVSLLYLAGLVAGPLLAVHSVVLLARDRSAMSRRTWRVLLALTVGAVVVAASRFTPVGADLHRWWMD